MKDKQFNLQKSKEVDSGDGKSNKQTGTDERATYIHKGESSIR